ncbi:MAG: B12-binding domain-containing radical SAM protein [Candidatus Rokubacteria bacterium]|nr:B12-binding domain-containing radical SAM protein [Candidatus Rokubacteria bacterium]
MDYSLPVKIYLVAPRNPESFWTFDRILPSLRKKCMFPNLSLPTVAGLTPPGHDIVLCDENVEAIDFDTDADIVGVTGYIVHKRRILEIVAEFRRRGKFVVAGGPYASLCPEELRGKVDVLFVDEAEYTWPQFIREYEAGLWQAEYRQPEKPSLRDSKLPRFDLLKVDRYRSMTIQFARGCPFTCEFCDIIVMYGRRPRTKSVEQVLAEVAEIHRLGMTNIFVVDDNFIGNKKEAKEVLKGIREWQRAHGYPIEFMTEVSLNVAQDEELLALMKQAHFTTIFVGIESPRKASLQETGKTQNMREDIVTSVHRIQAAGIEVMAGMIVGFDNDDPSIFEEQFRFIQDARIPISMTGMLNAMPQTPLYARLQKAGRLIADTVGDQFVFTNIIPQSMSRLELYEGYRTLIRRLYGYRSYRQRAMALIMGKGTMLHSRLLAGQNDLTLFARILWTCMLRASPRRAWLTLSLILETALRRPRALRDAVTLALMHKHFYEYVRDTSRELDALIHELRTLPSAGLLPATEPE